MDCTFGQLQSAKREHRLYFNFHIVTIISAYFYATMGFDQSRGGFPISKGLEQWISDEFSIVTHSKILKKLATVAAEFEKKERGIFTSPKVGKHIQRYLNSHTNRFIRSRIVDSSPSIATTVKSRSAATVIFENVREGGFGLQMGADILIGVNLWFAQFFENPKRPYQSFSNVLALMCREEIACSLSLADITIEIPGIEKTSLIDMQQHDTLIALGKGVMTTQMKDLIERVKHFESEDEHA